jgi:hypothetical protein
MNDVGYAVESRWGGSEDEPSTERMRELIAELDVRDEEHPDTWLVHADSAWSLRFDEDRYAYLTDSDYTTPAHMTDVSAQMALELWTLFSKGGPDAVSGFPWIKGERQPTDAEIADKVERARHSSLQLDRDFVERLGAEYTDYLCRAEGCGRGHVRYSVLCRLHHVEQIMKRPLPPALLE